MWLLQGNFLIIFTVSETLMVPIFTKLGSSDIAERENDLRLAQHVTYVHQNLTHPPIQTDPLPIKTMQRYLELCKTKVRKLF